MVDLAEFAFAFDVEPLLFTDDDPLLLSQSIFHGDREVGTADVSAIDAGRAVASVLDVGTITVTVRGG